MAERIINLSDLGVSFDAEGSSITVDVSAQLERYAKIMQMSGNPISYSDNLIVSVGIRKLEEVFSLLKHAAKFGDTENQCLEDEPELSPIPDIGDEYPVSDTEAPITTE